MECVLKGSSMVRYSFLCASTCTLAKEDQLFPGLGLYSGLFAVYLQCSSNKSRTAIIYFYTLCLLYVLSIASILSDLIVAILQVSNNPIYKSVKFLSVVQIHISIPSSQPQIDLQSILFHLSIFQKIANGCCDFIAQCILVRMKHCTYHPFYLPKSSKIYRCWIVWGQNIRVVIIPSFLAVAYLGQSISGLFSFVKPISNLSSLVTWLVQSGVVTFVQGHYSSPAWVITVTLASFPLSMAVNTLVTGLIVFKILKVFSETNAISVKQTLGSTENTKLRHIIFIIIESGMALLAIQLVRLVLSILAVQSKSQDTLNLNNVIIVAGIYRMLNVIIKSVHFYFFCFHW